MNNQETTLFEQGQAPTIRNVRVGDKITTKEKNDEDEERIVTWMVQQIYPFFVYATSGRRRRCFNYGTLVQMGLENGFNENYEKEYARIKS